MQKTMISNILQKNAKLAKASVQLRHAMSQSNHSVSAPLTTNNIFSAANKERCQADILSVHPVRDVPWKVKGKLVSNAAVLLPMCWVNGEPCLLFTVRSTGLSSQPGEVSFPGGKADSCDADLVGTALREAQEEVGILPQTVDVWGCMNPVPGRNFQMAVTPVVALCGEIDVETLSYNKNEVDKVFARSITALCSPRNQRYTRFRTGAGYTLPVYTGGQNRIWGLTAVILHQLLTLLAPGLYNFHVPQG